MLQKLYKDKHGLLANAILVTLGSIMVLSSVIMVFFLSPMSTSFKVFFTIFAVINTAIIAAYPLILIRNLMEYPCNLDKDSLAPWLGPFTVLFQGCCAAYTIFLISAPGLMQAMSIGFKYADLGCLVVYSVSWVLKRYNFKANYQPLPTSN